jgi:hypothetical protein
MRRIFILNLKKLKVTISWLQNLLQVMKKYPQVLIPAIGNRNVVRYARNDEETNYIFDNYFNFYQL